MKHRWFKKFGMSFDNGIMQIEPENQDLLDYMKRGCYQDPFGTPDDNLEGDIKVEKEEIDRERRKKLRNLKHSGIIKNGHLEEPHSPTSPGLRRPSKSFDLATNFDNEGENLLNEKEHDQNGGSKKFHRHLTETEKNSHMRIIFKDSVALIHKDHEGLEEAMMSNIKRLTGVSLSSPEKERSSESRSISKSQLMIDEIDQEYDRFESMPIDVAVQTIPEIVAKV